MVWTGTCHLERTIWRGVNRASGVMQMGNTDSEDHTSRKHEAEGENLDQYMDP